MLTPEEKSERAKQISNLYPTPKPASELGPHAAHSKPTDLGMVAKQGIILGTVAALAFLLASSFLQFQTSSTTESQQLGILFIMFCMIIVLVVVIGFRSVKRQLSGASFGAVTFWAGAVAATVLSGSLYQLLFPEHSTPTNELWPRLIIGAIGIIGGTTLVMVIVTRSLEKSKPRY